METRRYSYPRATLWQSNINHIGKLVNQERIRPASSAKHCVLPHCTKIRLYAAKASRKYSVYRGRPVNMHSHDSRRARRSIRSLPVAKLLVHLAGQSCTHAPAISDSQLPCHLFFKKTSLSSGVLDPSRNCKTGRPTPTPGPSINAGNVVRNYGVSATAHFLGINFRLARYAVLHFGKNKGAVLLGNGTIRHEPSLSCF